MEPLLAGVTAATEQLAAGTASDAAASSAIMTTDSVPRSPRSPPPPAIVGRMAKGAGMLAPQLATMLVVLTTDADVDAVAAQEAEGGHLDHL